MAQIWHNFFALYFNSNIHLTFITHITIIYFIMGIKPEQIHKLQNSIKALIKWSFIKRKDDYINWLEDFSGKKKESWNKKDILIIPDKTKAYFDVMIKNYQSNNKRDKQKHSYYERKKINSDTLLQSWTHCYDWKKSGLHPAIPLEDILIIPFGEGKKYILNTPFDNDSYQNLQINFFCNYTYLLADNTFSKINELIEKFNILLPLNPNLFDIKKTKSTDFIKKFLQATIILNHNYILDLNQILELVSLDMKTSLKAHNDPLVVKGIKEIDILNSYLKIDKETCIYTTAEVINRHKKLFAKELSDYLYYLINEKYKFPFELPIKEKGFHELKLRGGSSFPIVFDEIRKRFHIYDLKKEKNIGLDNLVEEIQKDKYFITLYKKYEKKHPITFTKSNIRNDVNWIKDNLDNNLWKYI